MAHLSILNNPDIAHVLYLRGLMEKMGRGMMLILRSYAEHGLPPPVWVSNIERGVTVTRVAARVAQGGHNSSGANGDNPAAISPVMLEWREKS